MKLNPTRWLKRLLARRRRRGPLAVAKAACRAEDWPWLEPASVESNAQHWVVSTGTDPSGRNARIVIRKSTGRILCKSFMRRRPLVIPH
jgi:hypothetical protein